tara:strand:- start:387 stop:3752 length:3366 start_codon:yes stop_codon:yes gene_type:complete
MKNPFPERGLLNLPLIQKRILKYWRENGVFHASVQKGSPDFIFYEGPPSANGLPGIHHVMARSIKDLFCRYKTQKGFKVERRAGWDTHGLPVELGVEKALGITKEDIGKNITIEEYNLACKEAVMKYTGIWNDLTEKMGYWVDTENPYVTYKSKYIESVWWILSNIYKKGLIYKGYTIQPYSPKAGTGLSSHELNQPGCYRDVKDVSATALFKIAPSNQSLKLFGNSTVHFMAWTTTPWTLPSNTALTIGKKIEYSRISTFNPYTKEKQEIVIATDLISEYFKQENENMDNGPIEKSLPWSIISKHSGKEFIGLRYEPLLNYAEPYEGSENAFKIIPGNFVTTQDGTGIVHTAPTFGADDAQVAKEFGVPPMLIKDKSANLVPLVDLQGKFVDCMGDLAGKYVKIEYYSKENKPELSADEEICIKLKREGKAFRVQKYSHSYPHCWRTDMPILYYPMDSWFVKTTAMKERLKELNKEILWKPESTGVGRFGNWLENLNDWNLSRSRYWGVPLPIWRTADGKEEKIIESIQMLKEELEISANNGIMKTNPLKNFSAGDYSESNYSQIDLHRPHVDDWILSSSKNQPMYRESDLIDVWFDSGSMPYAQLHYPFENKDLIDLKRSFPADFIAEGVDQTRGWFFTMHAIAGLSFDSVAFKTVISNGLVLDKTGQKMSKRLGNTIDPFIAIEENGADALRWYMITNSQPWDNLKFDFDGVKEIQRKFFGTLQNTYNFFSLYANVDNYDSKQSTVTNEDLLEIDHWILSRLNSLIEDVSNKLDAFEPTKAYRPIGDFVQNELSNWYVRLCRRRFWKGEMGPDKLAAYQTLFTCLDSIARMIAPVSPFFADQLYQDLNQTTSSVHLSDFPISDKSKINKDLERKMRLAQSMSSLVLSIRKKERIRVRQPISKIIVPVLNQQQENDIQAINSLVLSEVNAKEIQLVKENAGIFVKSGKPNFRNLGRKAGSSMNEVADAIRNLTPDELKKLEENQSLKIQLSKSIFPLTIEDVEITTNDIPGMMVASDQGLTIAVDLTLTPSLIQEGIAREVVNRIQSERKEQGFEITDRVVLWIEADSEVLESIKAYSEYVCSEVLAIKINYQSPETNNITPNISELNGHSLKFGLTKS